MTLMPDNLEKFIADCRQRVDLALEQLLHDHCCPSPKLLDAMRYSLLSGGKRIRPILTYASGRAIGEINTATDAAACALEAIHAYSLIHDDLPAMDDDDLRRGQPTCHKAFDEATAILAGDALQALSFEHLATLPETRAKIRIQLVQLLAQASGPAGMVGGQAIDLQAVNQTLDLEHLQQMHRCKTGALIKASVLMGAMASGKASTNQIHSLTAYADAIGLAFQVQDDILDVTSDTQTLGKQQGADEAHNKPTYVSLLGLDGAKAKTLELYQQALDSLHHFDDGADMLRDLAQYIVQRDY